MNHKTIKDCGDPEDVTRILLAAASIGYFFTPAEAEELWEKYSREMCASWLYLPQTDERLKKRLKHLIEEEDVPELEDDEI